MLNESIQSKTVLDLKNAVDLGQIIIQPEFQREFNWDCLKKSNLIETIMLGYPINPLHLSVGEKWVSEVIDGQQRLTTIVKFLKNKFALSGLEVLKEFNGLHFKKLPEDTQLSIINYEMAIFKYDGVKNPNIKYDIFKRQNAGSSQLTAHEMRNCVFYGDYVKLINELAAIESFKKLHQIGSKRMKDKELVLTFFALENYNPDKNYKDIRTILDNELSNNINLPGFELKIKKERFINFIECCSILFSDTRPFRKQLVHSNKTTRSVFNDDIYRAFCTVIPNYSVDVLKQYKKPLALGIKNLMKSDNFTFDNYMEYNSRVHKRAKILKQTIDNILETGA